MKILPRVTDGVWRGLTDDTDWEISPWLDRARWNGEKAVSADSMESSAFAADFFMIRVPRLLLSRGSSFLTCCYSARSGVRGYAVLRVLPQFFAVKNRNELRVTADKEARSRTAVSEKIRKG